MGKQSNETGAAGEKIALKYLREKGFKLVKQNYRIPGGEIDLIMEKDETILFVEVKTRTSLMFGDGGDAIDYHKKQKLKRAIFHYLYAEKVRKKWRCDMISLRFSGGKVLLSRVRDIFLT